MRTRKRVLRRDKQVPLAESLNKLLTTYALAAGAAGVSLLAASSPAQADILPGSPTSATIGPGTSLTLHIGGSDFVFDNVLIPANATFPSFLGSLRVTGEVLVSSLSKPAALSSGAKIGPTGEFLSAGSLAGASALIKSGKTSAGAFTSGNFGNAGNKFLGLKFDISGQAHFGWAEFSVTQAGGAITAQLLADAYEVCANTAVAAGATSSSSTCSSGPPPTVPEPSTLSLLAMGAMGLLALRRKRQKPETHGRESR